MGLHPTIISLFTGYGGLEMGLDSALGGTRTVCMVEREAFAIANLVAQMEAGAVAPAPIWTDVATFDGRGWRPDIITAGIPCQPWSCGGLRLGLDDDRWVWPDVARIVGETGAPVLFLECTPGLRRGGLPIILHDLAALGFDGAEWGSFTASEAGAPHRRTRLFLLAYSDREQLRQLRRWGSGQGGTGAAQPQHAGATVGNADSARPQEHSRQRRDARAQQSTTVRASGGMGFPPGPDDSDGWRRWLGSGGPQPGIRGGTHGAPDRVDRIRLLGNGVCPAQAALAFRELSSRAFE